MNVKEAFEKWKEHRKGNPYPISLFEGFEAGRNSITESIRKEYADQFNAIVEKHDEVVRAKAVKAEREKNKRLLHRHGFDRFHGDGVFIDAILSDDQEANRG